MAPNDKTARPPADSPSSYERLRHRELAAGSLRTMKWRRKTFPQTRYRYQSLGLTKKGLHLSLFRFRGTTLCSSENADGMVSLPLATGVGDWRSWTARGVCIGNLTDPSTSRCCALAWRRLGGRKIEQGESRSASRVMFHTKVRCSGHVRPTFIGWALPVRQPFFVSPQSFAARNRSRFAQQSFGGLHQGTVGFAR